MAVRSASPEAAHILKDIGLSLPPGWDIVRLESLLQPDRGIAVGVMYPGDHDPEGVQLIKAGDLSGGRINPTPDFRISQAKHIEYKRTELCGQELLISLVGNVGLCAVVPPAMAGWNVARAIAVLRFASPSDAWFVRYCLMSGPFQHLMKAWSTTTVQATLNLKEIRQIPLPWPPSAHRDAVVAVLRALDDKIEVNRRTNEILEATAQAIFKDWFIDFGPCRAKQEGGERYLAPDVWSLFPGSLDEEGNPLGWMNKRVEDILELAYGRALKATERLPGSIPVYGSGGITGYHNESLVEGPSIVIGRKGTVGSLYWEDRPFFPIDTVFFVKPTAPLTFCYYHLQTLGLSRMNTDAAVPGLNRSNVYRLPVPWGPAELRVRFDEAAKPLRQLMRANCDEIEMLETTRDFLLPKLLSGEVRVNSATSLI